jgi:hypothetical protein
MLRVVNAPVIRNIPMLAYFPQELPTDTTLQRPLDPISLYQGLDSCAGELKPSPFQEAKDHIEPTYSFPAEYDWRIASDSTSLAALFSDLHELHSERFNMAFAPRYLSHVHVSAEEGQYGLCVALRWASKGLRFYLPEPEKVNLTADGLKLLKEKRSEFVQTYGDHYVVNIERRTCATVVWRISFGQYKEDLQNFRTTLLEKFATSPSPQEGADIIKTCLKEAPNPERRDARAYLYFSSPDSNSLVLDTDTKSMIQASDKLAMQLTKKAEIITRFQIFPYKFAIPATQSPVSPSQEGFLSWANALQNVYYAMNNSRKLPKAVPEREEWDKQLQLHEQQLLENQKTILSGQKATAVTITQEVKKLQNAIETKVQDVHNAMEPLQKALDDWVAQSRTKETKSILGME